jgi:hypothetical protein
LSQYLTKHHAIKHWEVDVQLHVFLTSALGGEWSALSPGLFNPGTHWIGGWVDPGAGLDAVTKRKNPITDPAGK